MSQPSPSHIRATAVRVATLRRLSLSVLFTTTIATTSYQTTCTVSERTFNKRQHANARYRVESHSHTSRITTTHTHPGRHPPDTHTFGQTPPPQRQPLQWTLRILLECIIFVFNIGEAGCKKIFTNESFNFNFRSEDTNNASAVFSRAPSRFDAGWTDEANPKFLSYIREEWLVPPSHARAKISSAGQNKVDFSQVGQSSFVDKVCLKNHCYCLEDFQGFR